MPKLIVINLPEREESNEPELPAIRLESQTRRADAAYEQRWFADFRERWQKALRDEHLNYIARLEGVTS